MFSHRYYRATLIIAIFAAPLPLRAETELPTLESLLDSRSVVQALQSLDQTCRDIEEEMTRDFYKTKRKINRSLGSLDRRQSRKEEDTHVAQLRFARQLRETKDYCAKTRRKVLQHYAHRDIRERVHREKPVPTTVPASKPAQAPKAPKKALPVSPRAPLDLGALFRNFSIKGRLSQTAVYRANEPQVFTQNRSELALEQRTHLSETTRFKFSQRAAMDTVIRKRNDRYRGEGTYEQDKREAEFELRDAYMDLSRGDYDFRIGKQQVVWGEAVFLFVADVVNGRDLRDFLLPDPDRIRLPQWSAVVTRTRGSFVQEIMASVPRMDKLPPRGSEFELPQTIYAERPGTNVKNLDLGSRFSYLIGGWDLGAFYLYGWNKTPILLPLPAYKRQSFIGFTFSKDVWFNSILKGEAVVKPENPLLTTDPMNDGVTERTVSDAMVGLDRTFFEHYEVSLQGTQRFIQGKDDFLINDRNGRKFIAFWIRRADLFGRLSLEYTLITDPERSDRIHRPKASVSLFDRIQLSFGADLFEGKPAQGLFGSFEDDDRIHADFQLYF